MDNKKDGIHFPSHKIPIVGLAYVIVTIGTGLDAACMQSLQGIKNAQMRCIGQLTLSDYLKFCALQTYTIFFNIQARLLVF